METVVIIRIAESHESQTLLLRAALLERTPLACYENIRDLLYQWLILNQEISSMCRPAKRRHNNYTFAELHQR